MTGPGEDDAHGAWARWRCRLFHWGLRWPVYGRSNAVISQWIVVAFRCEKCGRRFATKEAADAL